MDSIWLTPPTDLPEWEARRQQIRAKLYDLLGDVPPLFTPLVTLVSREARDGFTLEKITFANSLGDTVYGYVLVPDQPNGAAVLYCHYHGGKYHLGKDELFDEPLFGEWADQTARGVALARAGYVVLAVDAYAFGERQHQGSAGEREAGRETEWSLFKQFVWEGRSLWAMIVHDDLLALNYLMTRPDVDPARIAVTGASMGGSRATWLAALDDRIKLVAPVIQYTRYQNLVAAGGLNGHSFYYYVPGVLKSGLDMEALAALAAPRPQLVLVGDSDPLSPRDGIQTINTFVEQVYQVYGAVDRFVPHVYAGQGHVFSVAMFRELLDFLGQNL